MKKLLTLLTIAILITFSACSNTSSDCNLSIDQFEGDVKEAISFGSIETVEASEVSEVPNLDCFNEHSFAKIFFMDEKYFAFVTECDYYNYFYERDRCCEVIPPLKVSEFEFCVEELEVDAIYEVPIEVSYQHNHCHIVAPSGRHYQYCWDEICGLEDTTIESFARIICEEGKEPIYVKGFYCKVCDEYFLDNVAYPCEIIGDISQIGMGQ